LSPQDQSEQHGGIPRKGGKVGREEKKRKVKKKETSKNLTG
jgi:hypothetical protein